MTDLVIQSGNVALTSSIIQYVIFLVTTGFILPVIDRVGRRWLLLVGAVICGVLHFITGAVMAVYGHHVDSIDGKPCLILALPIVRRWSRHLC